MRIRVASSLAAALALAAFSPLSSACQAQDKSAAKTQAPYASPSDVFDAYCKAMKDRDRRAMLSCLTPELRERLIFAQIAGCNESTNEPAVHALLKAYDVVDSVALQAEYNKKYKEKHGADPANWQSVPDAQRERIAATLKTEAVAEERYDMLPGGLDEIGEAFPKTLSTYGDHEPPRDLSLLRRIVISRITGNAEFFDKLDKAITSDETKMDADISAVLDKASSHDDMHLYQVLVKDDTATGHYKATFYGVDFHSGRTYATPVETIELTCYFRKSKGGWLFDGVTEPPKQKAPAAAPQQQIAPPAVPHQ